MSGKRLTLAVALAALALPLRAFAEPVVYTSFGPNNTFDSAASFFGFDTGEEGDPDSTFSRAFAFTPSSTVTLSGLDLPLQFPFSFSNGTLQINVYASDGSLPGALLESFNSSNPIDSEIVHFTSALHPLLSAGATYFVEATTLGQGDGLWFLSPLEGGQATDVVRVNNGPTWLTGTREFNAAFSVSGDPVGATPEPGTLLLLGTGLVALRRGRMSLAARRKH
ncbi:MAG TPA: choice-of-anchor R domain-containing protein [Vicinamibacterales bacterium]|nr:choice-of-anchor R domain-containing protein [Vicinamibacterales bacterium]